jgi:phytoene dehydrogenase-like protein
MADQSIIIIGAGIAGLSAGCYGQMNGYLTKIFELHTKPGGLCTSWKRKEYTFDGCLHWLVGSGSGSNVHRLWEELGAVQGRHMVDHEEFLRIEGTGGKAFIVYTDIDRLERHMKELAPSDTQLIEELCNAMRDVAGIDMPLDTPDEPPPDLEMDPQLLAFIETMGKYSTISIQDTAARFKDPFLRWAFPLAFDLPDFPTSAALMTLAWMHKHDAGYPIGGSLAFSQGIERRYLELGGQIHYKSRVQKILVENERAVGVRLADGTEHRADVVISAGDGHATIFDMLDGKYVSDEVRGYYKELPIFQPIIQVSLGVARDLSNEPHMTICTLDQPVTIAGEVRNRLGVKHYCYDPTLAPPGKSVLTVMFGSDYEYWKRLREDRERYKAEKKQISDVVIAQLEKRFPGIGEQIEVVDVATPMTYERFTGNWKGSMEGWVITTETVSMIMGPGMSKTLPGLESFYMAGQWVQPGGGVPTAAMSGRKVIQMICEADGKPFVATTP